MSEAGQLAAHIMRTGTWTDQAACLHAELARALVTAGFDVEFEVWAPFEDIGRAGRIDLLAGHGPSIVAIELDARKPRQNSVRKLRQFRHCYKIIGLRGVEWSGFIPGINDIVAMRVRSPTAWQSLDKRSVNRFEAYA